ncbi:hypothetical protein SAMN04488557_2228 [Hyphomicrobium facile]|uniref:Uncharacterized protein n=1 Tax=Hyphomicrobium facile TaxID=51670 RepID=A0A1I7NHI5_9HYPH|nr:hypothetical protein SAMN04488557_2228 [Hyphomicrobium facile]
MAYFVGKLIELRFEAIMSIGSAVVEKMNSANIAYVSAIARNGSRLVGYLGWNDIIGSQISLRTRDT